VPQDTDQNLLLFPLYVSGIYAGCFWYLLAPALHHICIRGNDAAEYLLSMCRQRWSHKSMGKKGSKEQQEYYSVSLLQKKQITMELS